MCTGTQVLHGTGEGGWGHLQVAVHMVAARLGCERGRLGPGGPILTLTARTGLETSLIPFRGLVSGKEGCLGSEQECDN